MWIPSNFPIFVRILETINISLTGIPTEVKGPSIIKYEFSDECIVAANSFAKNRFPDQFLFGFTTSAYQIEGSYNLTDIGESLWDNVVHLNPRLVKDMSNADVAADSYNKFKTDVNLVKNLGANTYRISLSWTRIFPSGFSDYISQDGIRYYNDLIDEMLKNRITPIVTLYDMDLPFKIQEMGGWANPLIISWFDDFARKAFSAFGDRVKHWVTVNSPYKLCKKGYGGTVPPGLNLSGIADYICGHHVLLAHAKVYSTYDRAFRWKQKGKIGLSLEALWFESENTSSNEDARVAEQLFQFANGWFLHPILGQSGDYPEMMKKLISNNNKHHDYPLARLPKFKTSEILSIRNSIDFLGLNYYSASMIEVNNIESYSECNINRKLTDLLYDDHSDKIISSTKRIGDSRKSTPWALEKFLIRINKDYKVPPIFITENGYSDNGELYDMDRTRYYYEHILQILKISKMGFDIRGYLFRTLMDCFEWEYGYTKHFGVYHVDYEDQQRSRKAKLSTELIRSIYTNRTIPSV
ncbi:myrosinase 1-like [Belonocnema kinseyi]|uniref:myrosinase 1-like n=1 Tax=Belonocnema kinseyi TaxID=2817044 RepID=UPI00143DAE85|nr:myrosinase 1-like [Belonocnema kinseyi]XP_033215480.1 myrosinase 1-like [Belonocnema kinseyi]